MAGSFLAGAAYTISLNPEVGFWKIVSEVVRDRAAKLETQGRRKVVLAGDSSCSFQLDAGVLSREYGMPTINAGVHAGMGLKGAIATAAPLLRPGDMLVIHCVPDFFSPEPEISGMAFQSLAATGNLWKQEDAPLRVLGNYSLVNVLLSLRPGLYNSVTMLGKLLTGRPLYRYSRSDVDVYGTMSTHADVKPVPEQFPFDRDAPFQFDGFFDDLREQAARHNIQLVYMPPVRLVEEQEIEKWRTRTSKALEHLDDYAATIDDGRLGATADSTIFADTVLHLNGEERSSKTHRIGPKLRALFDRGQTSLERAADQPQ